MLHICGQLGVLKLANARRLAMAAPAQPVHAQTDYLQRRGADRSQRCQPTVLGLPDRSGDPGSAQSRHPVPEMDHKTCKSLSRCSMLIASGRGRGRQPHVEGEQVVASGCAAYDAAVRVRCSTHRGGGCDEAGQDGTLLHICQGGRQGCASRYEGRLPGEPHHTNTLLRTPRTVSDSHDYIHLHVFMCTCHHSKRLPCFLALGFEGKAEICVN